MHNSGHQIQEFGVNCQTSANFSTYILLKTTQYSHFNALIRYAVCIFGNIFNCYYSEQTNVQIVMNKDSAINAQTKASKLIIAGVSILAVQRVILPACNRLTTHVGSMPPDSLVRKALWAFQKLTRLILKTTHLCQKLMKPL